MSEGLLGSRNAWVNCVLLKHQNAWHKDVDIPFQELGLGFTGARKVGT